MPTQDYNSGSSVPFLNRMMEGFRSLWDDVPPEPSTPERYQSPRNTSGYPAEFVPPAPVQETVVPEGTWGQPSIVAPQPPADVSKQVEKFKGKKAAGGDKPSGDVGVPTVDVETEDKGIKNLEKLVKDFEAKKAGLDYSPLASLVDTWTGSQFARGYEPPMSQEERDDKVLQMKSNLAEEKANLAYKREYMNQQSELAKFRERKALARERRDREHDFAIEGLKQTGRDAKAEEAKVQKDLSNKSRFLKDNRNAIKRIAKARYPTEDENDRSYEIYAGPINDEVYEFGKHLEENMGVKKGTGYTTSLKYFLSNPNGPSGKKR